MAELGEDFGELSRHICIVGYCQLAIVLLAIVRDYQGAASSRSCLPPDRRCKSDASACTLRAHLSTEESRDPDPIYGRYARLQYPNWAAKFFADALLLKIQTYLMKHQHIPELGTGHVP